MWLAGRVIAKYTEDGVVSFKPAQNDFNKESLDWTNYDFQATLMQKVKLDSTVRPCGFPKEGKELSIVGHIVEGELLLKAVPDSWQLHYICEQW